MATEPEHQAEEMKALEGELLALEGVERVMIDERGAGVWLLCPPVSDYDRIEAEARKVLAGTLPDVPLELVVRMGQVPQQRVRLAGVNRFAEPDGRVRARVELEWRGVYHVGEAVDGSGPVIEMRTAAAAALKALNATAGTTIDARLLGVKEVRAFDVTLVVVSVVRQGFPGRSLVGTVQSAGDPHRAAAMALLQALNRVMGNYLDVSPG